MYIFDGEKEYLILDFMINESDSAPLKIAVAKIREIIKQKISQFKSDMHSLQNAEIIQTPVEKFKEVVISKLFECTTLLLIYSIIHYFTLAHPNRIQILQYTNESQQHDFHLLPSSPRSFHSQYDHPPLSIHTSTSPSKVQEGRRMHHPRPD